MTGIKAHGGTIHSRENALYLLQVKERGRWRFVTHSGTPYLYWSREAAVNAAREFRAGFPGTPVKVVKYKQKDEVVL